MDHPASQADKLSKLNQVLGSQPAHVVYVPVDFNAQKLDQRLAESGYDESLKTLFIWQGVTQYLTAQAVDETVVFIANYSGPGNSIIFDYMYTTLLDGTIKRGEVSNMRNKGWVSGERMVFGIPEGQVTEFLEQCGFTNVLDADHMYLHDTDFTGENAKQTVAYPYAIASAVVKPKS